MPHDDINDRQWRTVEGVKTGSLVRGLMPALANVAATTAKDCVSSSTEQH